MSLIPKRVQATVDNAADKLATVAADTKRSVIAAAVMAAVAVVVALVALVVAVTK